MPLYLLSSCLKSRYLQQSFQNLLKNPEKEVCAFDNADIAALRASSAFPDNTVFRPFDRSIRSDVSSAEWVCFPAYPFSLGLRYPFPEFMMQLFRTTGISFAQTMPMVWRVLIILNQIKNLHCSDLCIEDMPIAYRLRSHGSSRFLLFSTSSKPLILKATKNEDGWQRKFFFVKRDSIAEGANLPVEWLTTVNFKEVAPPTAESEERVNIVYRLPAIGRTFTTHVPSSSQYSSFEMYAPAKIPEVFDLDELDSYSDQVQVKKEPSPKATASSKPSSSKAIIIPKPSPATKPRSSSSRKRKEPDSLVISDTFPYEKHGFIEASGFMTSFLNQVSILILYHAAYIIYKDLLVPVLLPSQGLERLVHLYQESCKLNKMLESKLKEAEITISDQGMIAAAKSRHYEEKFKVMTQEHQTALNRAILQAQADLEAVHMQHEQDMVSYRESLKSSVVISLLQARLKMAHETKALGFECPSWDVGAWETKLKNLCGTSSKPAIAESSKAVEKATHTEKDAEEDPKTDAAEIIMDEEYTAP
ncbi:hypothetical protein HanXRQr2_Chr16g0740281 [Helianthus annuus]|uniref:Uncharacterized protein n=1 Tax=Helianthus annuus TaxID=4232 RepID=A0A9K3GX88_HELAN|nr:hypothetical protein HanXRQr2_Chr16g0740281 [Helianthus annuus]